jgi:hypothetical protein
MLRNQSTLFFRTLCKMSKHQTNKIKERGQTLEDEWIRKQEKDKKIKDIPEKLEKQNSNKK